MYLMKVDSFSEQDLITLKKHHKALRVDPNKTSILGEEQNLYHIIVNGEPQGFILLTEAEDNVCRFDGEIYEISIAMYQTQKEIGYSVESLEKLEELLLQSYNKIRLEATITDDNPRPEDAINSLMKAGFVRVCKDCKIQCPLFDLLDEWHKILIKENCSTPGYVKEKDSTP